MSCGVNEVFLRVGWWCYSREGWGEKSREAWPDQSPLVHECFSSSRAVRPKCHKSGRRCNTFCFYHPNTGKDFICSLPSSQPDSLIDEELPHCTEILFKHQGYDYENINAVSVFCASGLQNKAMQTSCDYFFSIYTFYIVVSSFCLSDIHLTSTRGTIEQTVGALNVERGKLMSPWELFVRSVGLGLASLHILRRALDPLTPAHINLAKYRGYYCNVSVAAPLVLFSRLSAGWMKAWLLGKQPLSFPFTNESPGWLHTLAASFHLPFLKQRTLAARKAHLNASDFFWVSLRASRVTDKPYRLAP